MNEKLNLQTSPTNNALPIQDLKANEKNDNLIFLRSFFEKLMDQPKQIELPKNIVKKGDISNSAVNNCLVLANKSPFQFEGSNNNNLIPSNMSIQSSNNSQVSQLINNIEEGLDNKRITSSPTPYLDENNLFSQAQFNSLYNSRVECNLLII